MSLPSSADRAIVAISTVASDNAKMPIGTSTIRSTKVSAGKWTHWGELTGVDYAGENEQLTINNEQLKKPTIPKTVRKGSKGDVVKEMQSILEKLGYDLGPCGVDGDFGRMTERAVKAFQQDHGLKVDGICGPKTFAALLRLSF